MKTFVHQIVYILTKRVLKASNLAPLNFIISLLLGKKTVGTLFTQIRMLEIDNYFINPGGNCVAVCCSHIHITQIQKKKLC